MLRKISAGFQALTEKFETNEILDFEAISQDFRMLPKTCEITRLSDQLPKSEWERSSEHAWALVATKTPTSIGNALQTPRMPFSQEIR